MNISETVRACTKMHGMTLKDLDICQQMISLQKLHLMTVTYGKKWEF